MTSASPTQPSAPPGWHIGAVIVAAGRGTRMGGDIPKQYQIIGGRPVLSHTLERLATHSALREFVLVIHGDDSERARASIASANYAAASPPRIVIGGETRAASVSAGLAALSPEATHVLIHDGARPFVSHDIVDRVIAGLAAAPAAAPALPVTDALWRAGQDRVVSQTVPRADLWRAQTPQGFDLLAIKAAHANARPDAADDVEVARAAGLAVAIVAGEEDNIKLTRPEDMVRAERHLTERIRGMTLRLGNGYDVHRFGPGTAVTLCGVVVPHDRALQGHSDADVGMHAITDAIYGALADGDIGRHFPPSDPQWKGAASDIFLRHAVARASERGFALGNVDCTLVCERPKIGPHASAMQNRLAEIMDTPPDRISVKATTSERLGFTGREEGIAALATVTLIGSSS